MGKLISLLSVLCLLGTLVLVGLKLLGYVHLDWLHVMVPFGVMLVLNLVNFVLHLFCNGGFLFGLLILFGVGLLVFFFWQQGQQSVNFNPGAEKVEQQFYK